LPGALADIQAELIGAMPVNGKDRCVLVFAVANVSSLSVSAPGGDGRSIARVAATRNFDAGRKHRVAVMTPRPVGATSAR
jgi:hypothetical protein